MECDKSSTLESIEDPVVVNPLDVSKKASIKDGISPEITKGKAPKNDKIIHDRDTIINPSFACIPIFLGFLAVHIVPRTSNVIITIRKLNMFLGSSLYMRLTSIGNTNKIPSTFNILPNINTIIEKFINFLYKINLTLIYHPYLKNLYVLLLQAPYLPP